MPHCSDANRVPVRPKPVATSSQIRSTSCFAAGVGELARRPPERRAACPRRPARAARRRRRRARRACARDQPAAIVEAVGSSKPGRAGPGSAAGRRASVPNPPSPSESEPTVSPWYASPNARYVGASRRRRGWPSTGTRSSAPARRRAAPSDAKRKCGSSTGTTAASASASSIDDPVAVAEHRRVGAPRSSWSRERGVELGDPVAERRDPQRRDRVEVAAAVDVDQLAALGALDDHRRVLGVSRHLGEAVPDDGRIAAGPLGGAHCV